MTEDIRLFPEQDIAAKLDAACKQQLADRKILAVLLKSTLPEFKNETLSDIAEKWIEEEPHVAEIPVHRLIRGVSNEDASVQEGQVRYDIRFMVRVPEDGMLIRMIVNVEAQNKHHPGYPLVKRGLYYCSRMISAQYGTEFDDSEYENIIPVNSIWICLNPPKYKQNTITIYEMSERNIIGEVHENKRNYDLQRVVMVCLGDYEASGKDGGILPLLDALFASEMDSGKRNRVVKEEYGVIIDPELDERSNSMCNYSEYVYEKGMEKGMEKGILSTLYSLVGSRLLSIDDAAVQAKMTSAEFLEKMTAYNTALQSAK